MRQRMALITFVGLFAALGFLLLGSGSVLPERVATHFGVDGLPNGWMSRSGFMTSMAAVVIVPVALMQGLGLFIGRLPTSLINLPNRDYWLSGDRRTKTIEHLRTALLEFGNATFAFLLFVVWSVIQANTMGDGRLGGFFGFGLFAFFAFVVVWVVFLIKPYLKAPEEA